MESPPSYNILGQSFKMKNFFANEGSTLLNFQAIKYKSQCSVWEPCEVIGTLYDWSYFKLAGGQGQDIEWMT